MKAAGQYFPVVLSIVRHKVILAAIFGWNSSILHSFYIHTFYGAFFFTLQKVFLLSFSFVAEHSRQSSKAVPLWSIVSLLYFRCSCPKFWVYEFEPKAVVNNTSLLSRPFLWYCVGNLTLYAFFLFEPDSVFDCHFYICREEPLHSLVQSYFDFALLSLTEVIRTKVRLRSLRTRVVSLTVTLVRPYSVFQLFSWWRPRSMYLKVALSLKRGFCAL